jgi:hypothetical protein
MEAGVLKELPPLMHINRGGKRINGGGFLNRTVSVNA